MRDANDGPAHGEPEGANDGARQPQSPEPSRGRGLVVIVASALTAAGALACMYVLSETFLGVQTPERIYLSGRCGLGDAVIALNAHKALPWLALAFMAPLAVLTTISLGLFLGHSVRLFRKSPPACPKSVD